MNNKNHRAGGKFNGNHTTLISAACLVADIAAACPAVTSIAPGFIKGGLKVAARRHVKIRSDGSSILLSVRDAASHQEVRVYVSDMQAAKLAIARGSRDAGLDISFG